jgi:hypothetical protein
METDFIFLFLTLCFLRDGFRKNIELHNRNLLTLSHFILVNDCTIADTESWMIYIQRVTEISTLILTGNRTRQKEQLFYLPFCRKTMFNSKKKLERFFTNITLRH